MKNSAISYPGFVLAAALVIVTLSVGHAIAQNTHFGTGALSSVTTGTNNSALGFNALHLDTTGSQNTASGQLALSNNSKGFNNTATGVEALASNTTGVANTATGTLALAGNITGIENTAIGESALSDNTSASFNTAAGFAALASNTVGVNNTATGVNALLSNDTGNKNTAVGVETLSSNTGGGQNTAGGVQALFKNSTGNSNTAYGLQALFSNTTGSNNTALGFLAGINLTTGSNNIEIASVGNPADSATIRIGTQGTQTQTIIAGITGSAVTGSDVVVNGSGKLGVVVSSARYKRDINDMGSSTDALMKLRPVTFVYKSDQQAVKQYGLVAEEVNQVYPELVVHSDSGEIQSVRYSMLTSMLLNELQKQTKTNQQQADRIAHLEKNREHDLQAARERESAMKAAFEQRLAHLERTITAVKDGGKLEDAFNR